MNIVVADLLVHYDRPGIKHGINSGKTPRNNLVLIIPGWADTASSWRNVQTELAAEFDVVVLDLPGFGGSQKPTTDWGLDDYADFIGAFVVKLGAGQPYAVIGHSNGGAVAIKSIAAGSVKPTKLVLIAAAGIRSPAALRNSALKIISKTGKFITAPLPARVRRRLRQHVYKRAGSDMLIVEDMQASFKKIVATDVQADAAALHLPTLLIYGDVDTATPLAFGRTYNKLIADSTLKILPGAGHFAFIEQPAEVLRLVREFLI